MESLKYILEVIMSVKNIIVAMIAVLLIGGNIMAEDADTTTVIKEIA